MRSEGDPFLDCHRDLLAPLQGVALRRQLHEGGEPSSIRSMAFFDQRDLMWRSSSYASAVAALTRQDPQKATYKGVQDCERPLAYACEIWHSAAGLPIGHTMIAFDL